MAILLRKETTVLVQGITGREGSARAAFMKGYGTKVVAVVSQANQACTSMPDGARAKACS